MSDKNPTIGKQVGNYRILAEIGSGGFGRVYRGEHIFLTERMVAIKFLHTHLSLPEERERFLQEARLLEKLKHPDILLIFDVGIDENFPYLVAEYAPNGSLRNRLKHSPSHRLPIEEAIHILCQIGQALQYAHHRQIIHRDLKPENILFNAKNQVLLADFGIATTLTSASVQTSAILGSPPYMAPEQFRGNVSKESDQYALGCIAYELVTGQPPFTAPDFFALGFKHLTAEPFPPSQLNPNVPKHVEQAILKALAKERTDRHHNVQTFINALRPSLTPLVDTYSTLPTSSSYPTQAQESFSNITQTAVPPGHPSFLENVVSMSAIPTYGLIKQVSVPNAPNDETYVNHVSFPPQESEPSRLLRTPSLPTETAIWITPADGPQPKSNKGNSRSKYTWLLVAVACIVLLVSVIGTFAFVLPSLSHSGTASINTSTPQGQINTSITTTLTSPTQSKVTPSAQATKSGAAKNPTPTTKVGPAPKPTATSATPPIPRPTVDPTPIPITNPDPTSDPSPITDNLIVPFTSTGVSTTHSYQGTVTITVSGTGQAGQTKLSDAFYFLTDTSGTPVPPQHPSCWILNINGQDAINFVPLPSYQSSNVYTFQINAPGGHLIFDVCDNKRSDNTGQYNITVTQN